MRRPAGERAGGPTRLAGSPLHSPRERPPASFQMPGRPAREDRYSTKSLPARGTTPDSAADSRVALTGAPSAPARLACQRLELELAMVATSRAPFALEESEV